MQASLVGHVARIKTTVPAHQPEAITVQLRTLLPTVADCPVIQGKRGVAEI